MGLLSGIGSALRAVADTFDQNKPRDMSDPRYWADFGGLASFAGAREVFGRAIAVHEYGDIWFANSGQTGGIIKHPGNFKDKEDKREFLDTWRSSATSKNRHRDRLLTHGADY
jgi:hypothetical protein